MLSNFLKTQRLKVLDVIEDFEDIIDSQDFRDFRKTYELVKPTVWANYKILGVHGQTEQKLISPLVLKLYTRLKAQKNYEDQLKKSEDSGS